MDSKCVIATSVDSQVLKVIAEHTTNSLIVAVTFNYDRVLQPAMTKMLEMIRQIVKTKQNYGKVLIKFGAPTST